MKFCTWMHVLYLLIHFSPVLSFRQPQNSFVSKWQPQISSKSASSTKSPNNGLALGIERQSNIFPSLTSQILVQKGRTKNPGGTFFSSISGVEEDDSLNNSPFFTSVTNKIMNQGLGAPFSMFVQDIAQGLSNNMPQINLGSIIPARPIASDQKQLPMPERIAKGLHEESAPWILSLLFPSLAAMAMKDISPLQVLGFVELSFLVFCSVKLFTKFDVPSTNPQPLLNDRNWDYIYNSVWQSHKSVDMKRKFLTAWFYDAPYECIRREDAIRFLAWMHFGIREEDLTLSQRYEVVFRDLPRLEYEVNNGVEFQYRSDNEEPLGCIRFNLEPLRYRHKPLLFYIVTHGTRFYIKQALKDLGFSYTPPQDSKKDLGYFYRPGSPSKTTDASAKTPLVFVHGVGGISYYYNLIKDIGDKNDSPIILIDLPFISLQVADNIPSVIDQVQSVCNIMNEKIGRDTKATFVGHSFGSLILSWMVQSCPNRVANCVFLDPICFQLHLRSTLFNFHFQRVDQSIQQGKRWENPFSAGSFINLAGTEMHTNNAMLRHFWWTTNALWPEDLEKNNIPTSVIVSENDEIVPSAEVEELFANYKKEKENIKNEKLLSFISNMEKKNLIRANMLYGANHGEFVFNDALRTKVVRTVSAMMRLNNIAEKKLENAKLQNLRA